MPSFFQALSKSTLHPTVREKHKLFLEHARPFFSGANIISRAENHHSLLRLNNERSETPLIKRMEHHQKSPFSSGVKPCNLEIEMPKWKRFKDHIRQLKQMYQPPQDQQLKDYMPKRKLPRVRRKHLFEPKKIFNKKVFEINQIKKQGIRFKPRQILYVSLAKPKSSNPFSPGFCHVLYQLLSKFVFRKKKAKRLTKYVKSNNKAKKIYERGNNQASKLLQKSLHSKIFTGKDTEKKLTELWPALVELGELKGPKNPPRPTKTMRYTILKKLSRTALDLPTEYREILKHIPKKNVIKHNIISSSEPSKRPTIREIKNLKKQPSVNNRFAFKLGKSLKIHDYGFKYLKDRASKLDDFSRTNILKVQQAYSISPPEAEVVSSKKVFHTMDMSLRRSTRQTAENMFLNIHRAYERKISSKTQLLEQLHRLNNLNRGDRNNFEYFGETDSDLSDQFNITFESTKRIKQSKANAALTVSDINSPQELFAFDDYEVVHVPSNKKKPKPVKLYKKRKPKNFKRIPVPQADAVTQTECECEICNFLQKYKAEKIPPLVKEMAIKQDFLAQRQYYMENVKHRNFKESNAEKRQNVSGSVIPFNQSDYNKNIYLRGFDRLSENYRKMRTPFGIGNSNPQTFKAYREPDVTNDFLRCYKTLFEAEQQTHNLCTNVFDPRENIFRA
ncbi:uncharacterized protein LOC108029519 [Drosophila biarmipes]|uniref:uncharacterized protein LOC108029519 n=1 Tax=Drosophila biarmipes TaxID=125945 RepID=UPI0007E64B39|nr:uncharacterized protein LOC108029519 [Drosophila biarmipes]